MYEQPLKYELHVVSLRPEKQNVSDGARQLDMAENTNTAEASGMEEQVEISENQLDFSDNHCSFGRDRGIHIQMHLEQEVQEFAHEHTKNVNLERKTALEQKHELPIEVQEQEQELSHMQQEQQQHSASLCDISSPVGPILEASKTRVYVSNLSYRATEEALFLFFKKYNPQSVLIPGQSIRGFKKVMVRPLGIAYIEFDDPSVAAKAIQDLNGLPFMNRQLKLRYHVPFKYSKEKTNPSQSKLHQIQRRITDLRKKNVAVVCTGENSAQRLQLQVQRLRQELLRMLQSSAISSSISSPTAREISSTTLYLGHLPGKTTDASLRTFFHNYFPQEIIVYKHRQFNGWRLRRHLTAAVITFPDLNRLNAALHDLSHEFFQGRLLKMAPAYEDKLSDIRAEVQRMAIEQRLPQAAANLGIYPDNNLIAMQLLHPPTFHNLLPQPASPSTPAQEEDQEPSPVLQQQHANPDPTNTVIHDTDLSLKVQPLHKFQKLQMIQKLHRLHKHRHQVNTKLNLSSARESEQEHFLTGSLAAAA